MKKMEKTMNEIFGDLIYAYTRKQAIEDGVLVDITEIAKPEFKVPVAMTIASYEKIGTEKIRIMLKDLWRRIKVSPNESILMFHTGEKADTVKLKSMIHGGDHGEPVLTIMFPNED